MDLLPCLFSFLLLFLYNFISQAQAIEFFFNGFNGSEDQDHLLLQGASVLKPSGALRLTNNSHNVIGHVFYNKPIQMFDRNSSSYPNSTSFSTSFVFAIKHPVSKQAGHGIAFTISPTPGFPGGEPGHYLGIFSDENNNDPSNHIFAVEFDTVNGFNESSDYQGNHIGVNVNGMTSDPSEPAAFYVDNTRRKEDFRLDSGKPIRVWIDYDGVRKLLNVTILDRPELKKPLRSLISNHEIDLTPIFKEEMYVGFSASTGELVSSHYILGWSFATDKETRELNITELPVPPKEKGGDSKKPTTIILISVFSSVTIISLVLTSLVIYRRIARREDLEEWETDCPRRLKYGDLYESTKGFKDSEKIGAGGFGVVYKGVLRSNGNELAIKRVKRNSVQGLREFAAEIESLGRLRHKNLVNLQGWCKQKQDLLIVYDYIQNGSLDSLLFKKNIVLNWDQRLKIIKGVTAGLLYLHEEWEKVVLHRDIKTSNVLIDGEMNARLGDFGLARLQEHGTISQTTSIVGTIGYIAPELARTGKPSTKSDVFAYGVMLLEIVTGRRPIDSSSFILVDWVMECERKNCILDAVDPKMESDYSVDEIEMVLVLGLLCSHNKPEARPTMRQVTRILNGDEKIPEIGKLDSIQYRSSERMKYFEIVSSDTVTESYSFSSIGMSSSSVDAAR